MDLMDKVKNTIIEIPERWMTSSRLPVWTERCHERMRGDVNLSHLPIPQGMVELSGGEGQSVLSFPSKDGTVELSGIEKKPILSFWVEEDPVPKTWTNSYSIFDENEAKQTGTDYVLRRCVNLLFQWEIDSHAVFPVQARFHYLFKTRPDGRSGVDCMLHPMTDKSYTDQDFTEMQNMAMLYLTIVMRIQWQCERTKQQAKGKLPVKTAEHHSAESGAGTKTASRSHIIRLTGGVTVRESVPTGQHHSFTRHAESWQVRGHYRHYRKSGKTIFIESYTKGHGSLNPVTYQMSERKSHDEPERAE